MISESEIAPGVVRVFNEVLPKAPGGWRIRIEEQPAPWNPPRTTYDEPPPPSPLLDPGSYHLRAEHQKAPRNYLYLASVITTTSAPLPRRWPREALHLYPGHSLAAAITGPDRCLAACPAGISPHLRPATDGLIEAAHAGGPPLDPGTYASALYRLIVRLCLPIRHQPLGPSGLPPGIPEEITISTPAGLTRVGLRRV